MRHYGPYRPTDRRYRPTPSIASTVLISIGFLAGGYAAIATASILAWAGMAGAVVAVTAGVGTAIVVPLGLVRLGRAAADVVRKIQIRYREGRASNREARSSPDSTSILRRDRVREGIDGEGTDTWSASSASDGGETVCRPEE